MILIPDRTLVVSAAEGVTNGFLLQTARSLGVDVGQLEWDFEGVAAKSWPSHWVVGVQQ